MTDIIETIHDALEAHLPAVRDAEARQSALRYLRGLKTYLASRPGVKRDNVIPFPDRVVQFEDHVIRRGVLRAVQSQRRRALAADTRVLQHKVNVFGDAMYDDDIE